MLSCNLCLSGKTELVFKKDSFVIFACRDCGLVFSHPAASVKDLTDIYGEGYLESWGIREDYEGVRQMKKETFRGILKKISRHQSGGSILDVGCAAGFFMETAKEFLWNPYGVEISRHSADIAMKKFPNAVFCGTIQDARYPDGFFNAVTLLDLIEHIACPVSFFKEVKRILKRRGVVLMTTPRVNGAIARIMGVNWPHYKMEHLNYFSKKTITELLDKTGFSVIGIYPTLKCLNLKYLYWQFKRYRTPFLTDMFNVFAKTLPERVMGRNFSALTGEMTVIARSR